MYFWSLYLYIFELLILYFDFLGFPFLIFEKVKEGEDDDDFKVV
jgi:hypothetical protein